MGHLASRIGWLRLAHARFSGLPPFARWTFSVLSIAGLLIGTTPDFDRAVTQQVVLRWASLYRPLQTLGLGGASVQDPALPAKPSSAPSPVPPEEIASLQTSSTSAHPFVFGVYAGGGNGEISSAPKPTASAVNQRLRELAGQSPFVVHLYTAWSWYNPTDLDQQVQQFRDAGLGVVLTVKYSPPAGHDGDVAGYEAFVRSVVDRYGTVPALSALVIGNEANVYGNPGSSDGPFARSHEAVVRGVIAAHEELQRLHSSARVGVNFAVTDSGADGSFLAELAKIGGPSFASSIQFVGIDVYPGIWPVGTGRPYADMRDDLAGARASVDSVAELRGKPIDILEVGAPVVGEQEQVDRLTQFVQACLDNREALNITSFIWFDLWDANSQSSSPYAHYGLLHSDLGAKPAFQAFQRVITAGS